MRTAKACGVAALALSISFLVLAAAPADEQHAKSESKLPLCPVMGEPIDFSLKTMTDEGPVYFCCGPCIRKFKQDSAKFADAAKTQRAAVAKLDRVQVICPVGGEPVDAKVSSKQGDQEVHLCCAKCKAEFEKDPSKYAAKLADCYTYQTKCPVGDGKIDPTTYVDLSTGERIYLCSKDCAPKLLADPVKYADALAAQGTHIDVKKLQKK